MKFENNINNGPWIFKINIKSDRAVSNYLIIKIYIDKKTIVFDLDETLVRAQRDEFDNGYDSRITVIDPKTQDGRPNRQYFVSFLLSHILFRYTLNSVPA